MIYYQITQFGLNAYTLKAPKCMLRVVDAQTGKFKMVAFNLAERSDLMIPMSYDMVKDLPNDHVTSLFVAAAHISLYVAHYEVIEIPTWVKLLKIVQVVLFIMALLDPKLRGLEAIVTFIIEQALIHYLMKEVIQFAMKKLDPAELMIVMIIAYLASGGFKKLDLSVFSDLFEFLGDLSNIIGQSLEHYAYEEEEDLRDEKAKQEALNERKMDPLNEITEALFQNKDGSSLDLTRSSRVAIINPMMADQYLSNSVGNYNLIGFGDFDFDSKFDTIFEPEIMLT